MKIVLAKTAGFCFGVQRSVNLVEDLLQKEKRKIVTLGPIIHNEQIVDSLKKHGVGVIESTFEAESGQIVVIRSHGVGKKEYEALKEANISYVDSTCPFVAKIHEIAKTAAEVGDTLFIIGDENHPEVQGIRGFSGGNCFVFPGVRALEKFTEAHPEYRDKPIVLLAQTTFHIEEWTKCQSYAKSVYTNCKVSDTICYATTERQTEAAKIASCAGVMYVIGSPNSSNSEKLAEVCRALCADTFFVSSAGEIDLEYLRARMLADKDLMIGVTAGASTPAYEIKEAIFKMEDLKAQIGEEAEQSFAEALESSLITLNTGDRVKGVVIGITPTEVQVNLGTKQAAYIPRSEVTNDPNASIEDLVKIGDEIEVFVTRVNDIEGTITLSKRKIDSIKGIEEIEAAFKDGTVMSGTVSEVVKGGVIIFSSGVRVFIPASQCPGSKDSNLEDLVGKEYKFKIIDFERRRNKVVGSIRTILREERKNAENAFWSTAEVGKKYHGIVKSLTSYGAFVDLGGIDGMLHISELSWGKIKHPGILLKVGDEIDVFIKNLDTEKKRISLGYKDQFENPWDVLRRTYKEGDVVKVKIARLTSFGAFAEVVPGVDGLIHISQIANRRIERPSSVLTVGEEVDAKIIAIDYEAQKLSLSIRALLEPEEPAAETSTEPAAE